MRREQEVSMRSDGLVYKVLRSLITIRPNPEESEMKKNKAKKWRCYERDKAFHLGFIRSDKYRRALEEETSQSHITRTGRAKEKTDTRELIVSAPGAKKQKHNTLSQLLYYPNLPLSIPRRPSQEASHPPVEPHSSASLFSFRRLCPASAAQMT